MRIGNLTRSSCMLSICFDPSSYPLLSPKMLCWGGQQTWTVPTIKIEAHRSVDRKVRKIGSREFCFPGTQTESQILEEPGNWQVDLEVGWPGGRGWGEHFGDDPVHPDGSPRGDNAQRGNIPDPPKA